MQIDDNRELCKRRAEVNAVPTRPRQEFRRHSAEIGDLQDYIDNRRDQNRSQHRKRNAALGIARLTRKINRALETVEAEDDARRRNRRQHCREINRMGLAVNTDREISRMKPLTINATPVAAGTTSLKIVIAVLECANSFTLQKFKRK